MVICTHIDVRNAIKNLVAYERSSRINGSGILIKRNKLSSTELTPNCDGPNIAVRKQLSQYRV